MNGPERTDIAAVVVLFNPSPDVLDNIDSYAAQVGRVIAVDNSERPDAAVVAGLAARNVDYLPMGGNAGIASALNAGCRRAGELGFSWALTMDQDSTATSGLVGALAQTLAGQNSGDIAIVAPMWQQVGGDLVTATGPDRERDYAMTSGNLLRLSAFDAIGGFREELFIDQVDNEFCLRLRKANWRIVQRPSAVLAHRMGALREIRFPRHFWVADYSPLRRYYMVRNLLAVASEYGADFPQWLADERAFWGKELVKIVVFEPQRLRTLRMMLRGWRDYRRGRLGRYDDLHAS